MSQQQQEIDFINEGITEEFVFVFLQRLSHYRRPFANSDSLEVFGDVREYLKTILMASGSFRANFEHSTEKILEKLVNSLRTQTYFRFSST